jgi:hypothetical protein
MDANQLMRVINHNAFEIKGMFDGTQYTFPSETPTDVPFEAVCHIFGYGLDRNDRKGITTALCRMGVLTLRGDYNAALAVRMKFEFRTGQMIFESPKGPGKNEEPDEDEEDTPPEKPDEGIGASGNPGAPSRPSSPGGESEATGVSAASADLPRRRGRPPKQRPEEY